MAKKYMWVREKSANTSKTLSFKVVADPDPAGPRGVLYANGELEQRIVALFPVNQRFDEDEQRERARQYADYMNEMIVVHPSISESVKKMFTEDSDDAA